MVFNRGKFIVLEGIGGSGKTTQAKILKEYLEGLGIEVVLTREPGGTPIAEELRSFALSDRPMLKKTEALVIFAARNEHIHNLIVPALNSGKWVVCDRFIESSYAYQGGGNGISMDDLDLLSDFVLETVAPDMTILFDLPFEVVKQRLASRSSANGENDRFDRMDEAYFQRVIETFKRRFKFELNGDTILNADRPIEEVTSDIIALTKTLFD